MTDRELLLQWLQPGAIVPVDTKTVRILLDALRERLAQPLRTHWEGCEEVHPECKMPAPPRREWVGLTEKDFSAINQSCLTKLQAATSAESILKEKNT